MNKFAPEVKFPSICKEGYNLPPPCGVPMEQMVIVGKDEARRQLGWDPNKKYILFGGAFSNTRKNYALLRDAIQQLVPFPPQLVPFPPRLVPFLTSLFPFPQTPPQAWMLLATSSVWR